jgi:NADP-dependent aldehyde dehydrogenase
MLQGKDFRVGRALVQHPLTRAVGFTGSFKGGKALFDLAVSRPVPIPVYAEMGSINPVFILPGALKDRARAIAEGLFQSMNLGVGQFCTNPGLVVGLKGSGLQEFMGVLTILTTESRPGTMLHSGIRDGYEAGLNRLKNQPGVEVLACSSKSADREKTEGSPTVLLTNTAQFRGNRVLAEEVFGPSTLVVECDSIGELNELAVGLEGHLTATVHAKEEDLDRHADLIRILENKVGRLVFNGFPTGVEVCHAMHHGGPYPATSDGRSTSVGSAAIRRFARPICYQNAPQNLLPPELRDENETGIWRLLDGQMTRG